MKKWIIPCNPNYYDVFGAFNEFDKINWKQSIDIQIGDTVYIYVSKPTRAIKFEAKVVKVDLETPTIKDRNYVIDGLRYENYGRYMELQLVRKFGDNLLSYDLLKKNGLKSVQGPSKVSNKLEVFILNQIDPAKIALERRYFFVFQNKSYSEEYNGGYLWAPQYGDNGRHCSHWDRMMDVRKGDLIIHSFMQKIIAISIAKEDVYASNRPTELPNQWNREGWRVDTEYHIIQNPIKTTEHMEKLLELQPKENAPFNKIGKGNTGYLFFVTKEMASYIIQETAATQATDVEKNVLCGLLEHIKEDKTIESNLDQELIEEIDDVLSDLADPEEHYNPAPKGKPEPIVISGKKAYPRDRKTAISALKRAQHNCEINKEHPSFVRKNTNTPYAEPHHLIPMAYQELFDYSLDVEANIVCLCSNCHNQIHYGRGSETLIEMLYLERKQELEKTGISISLDGLLALY